MTTERFRRRHFSRPRVLREAAIAAALSADPATKTYTSSVPCLRGHVGLRYIKGDACAACAAVKVRRPRAIAA
jgi:hypothetical protein